MCFMDEKEKVIINNLIEDKKILWTVVIVLTGGVVGLLVSIDKFSWSIQVIFKIIVCLLGIWILYCMLINLISVTNQIKEKLRK